MKTKMYQNNQENSNSFERFANQALNFNEMKQLKGGDDSNGGDPINTTEPPIYIKEE